MPELPPKDRLQPALLDRLTDDEPGKTAEPREKRVLTMSQLRQSVLRDLQWLLNTGPLEQVLKRVRANEGEAPDLAEYPLASESVLNYGWRDLAGSTSAGLDAAALEKSLKRAIERFEPRLNVASVRIHELTGGSAEHPFGITIDGELWALPAPVPLLLETEVDLESGNLNVAEAGQSPRG